jgi:DNA-directed RNA polymerase specialized sigma subunit
MPNGKRGCNQQRFDSNTDSLNRVVGENDHGTTLEVGDQIAVVDHGPRDVDNKDLLERVLAGTKPKIKEILKDYYINGFSMYIVGQRHGYSEAQVSQIIAKALADLAVYRRSIFEATLQ